MKMEKNEIKEKLEKFLKAKIPIHIVLKMKIDEKGEPIIDRWGNPIKRFLNGMLIGKKDDDIFVINERLLGETYVLVEDIYDISVYANNANALVNEFIKENDIKLGEGVMKEEIDYTKEFNQARKTKASKEAKTSFK